MKQNLLFSVSPTQAKLTNVASEHTIFIIIIIIIIYLMRIYDTDIIKNETRRLSA